MHDLKGIRIRGGGASLRILRADGRRFPVVVTLPETLPIELQPVPSRRPRRTVLHEIVGHGIFQHRIKPQITGSQIARLPVARLDIEPLELRPAGAVFRVPFRELPVRSDEVAAFGNAAIVEDLLALLVHAGENIGLKLVQEADYIVALNGLDDDFCTGAGNVAQFLGRMQLLHFGQLVAEAEPHRRDRTVNVGVCREPLGGALKRIAAMVAGIPEADSIDLTRNAVFVDRAASTDRAGRCARNCTRCAERRCALGHRRIRRAQRTGEGSPGSVGACFG